MVSASPSAVDVRVDECRCRIALQGVTADVVAPSDPFAPLLPLAFGGYQETTVDRSEILVTITRPENAQGWEVAVDEQRYSEIDDVELALQRAEWLVINEALRRLPHLIHAHAAVVATPDQSILLVGHSTIGKSTTAVALAQLGMRLYTDDVALIEPATLRPIVVPRPIKLDDRSRQLLKGVGLEVAIHDQFRESVARTALPGLPPVDSLGPPLGLVVFLGWARQSFTQIRRLTVAEASMRLIQQSITERLDAAAPTAGALAAVTAASCFELSADSLAARLDAIMTLARTDGRTVGSATL